MRFDHKYSQWLERLGLYDTDDILWTGFEDFDDPKEQYYLIQLKLYINRQVKLLE